MKNDCLGYEGIGMRKDRNELVGGNDRLVEEGCWG